MLYHAFGKPTRPVIVLLHGAGVSWWNFEEVAKCLEKDYYVILPVVRGFGEAAKRTFHGVREEARELITLIETEFGGRVFALGGISLGAQIALEAMVESPKIAKYAILESILTSKAPIGDRWLEFVCRVNEEFHTKKLYAALLSRVMGIPERYREVFYQENRAVRQDNALQMMHSLCNRHLRTPTQNILASTLILYGEKEYAYVKRSAQALDRVLPNSVLYCMPGRKHGELAFDHPSEYADLLIEFFTQHGV